MDIPDIEKGLGGAQGEKPNNPLQEAPFSVFSHTQKRFIVFVAALTTLVPPLTASIYYPVITTLARELNVSTTNINLTISIYLVCRPKHHN